MTLFSPMVQERTRTKLWLSRLGTQHQLEEAASTSRPTRRFTLSMRRREKLSGPAVIKSHRSIISVGLRLPMGAFILELTTEPCGASAWQSDCVQNKRI